LGLEFDNETGSLHTNAREYFALEGFFNKPDRFEFLYPAYSPYHYSKNNPFRYSDASGDTATAPEIVVTADKEEDESPTTVDYILNHRAVTGSSVWRSSDGMWHRLNGDVFNDPFGVSTTPLIGLKNIPQLLRNTAVIGKELARNIRRQARIIKYSSYKTRNEIQSLIPRKEGNILANMFGPGPESSEELLKKITSGEFQIPEGLSRETLDVYAEIAHRSTRGYMNADGKLSVDPVGTQKIRLKIMEELLERFTK
jgi:RHS repeat-associated protein